MSATTFAIPIHQEGPSRVPILEERYEMGELLGEGGFARVFAAHDKVLGISVAVKVMNPEHAHAARIVESFAREANLVARMLSPHVVKVLGVAVTGDGASCVVYERLVGETLAARIERMGGLTLAATVDIIRQVSRGLARVHALGVVHRDIKPDNIFICEQPDGKPIVKLIDFGVAEMVDWSGAPAHDQVAGTPEYMAPEVLGGTYRADARSDLYALGVVAFECLTGRCPFEASTLAGVISAVCSSNRPYLVDLRPDLPNAIDAWMERALHPDPYWRFASTKEMTDALDQALRDARKHRPAANNRAA